MFYWYYTFNKVKLRTWNCQLKFELNDFSVLGGQLVFIWEKQMSKSAVRQKHLVVIRIWHRLLLRLRPPKFVSSSSWTSSTPWASSTAKPTCRPSSPQEGTSTPPSRDSWPDALRVKVWYSLGLEWPILFFLFFFKQVNTWVQSYIKCWSDLAPRYHL